jgi:restriction endonuclease Mrr
MLILVQAKRWAPHRKVSLEPVKALWASVEEEQANKGILVSTSEFQPAAREFAANRPYRIQLAGPGEVTTWLRQVAGRGIRERH